MNSGKPNNESAAPALFPSDQMAGRSFKAQEQDPGVGELGFIERLFLLVDQQWNWREDQALARRLKSAKLRHDACIVDIDYRAARGLEKTMYSLRAEDSTL